MADEIRRDNFLDNIDGVFDGKTDVVLLTGLPGVGKTVLLDQYSRRHSNTVIKLMIRPLSRLAYSLKLLTEQLYDQTCSLAHQQTVSDSDVDNGMLQEAFRALSRRASRMRTRYCIVVDGLDQIPGEDAELREHLINMMPFGVPGFCFLFSSNVPLTKQRHREVMLAPFTPEDSIAYLSDVITREHAIEVHRTCRGMPGHLASVRRVLQSGTSIEELLKNFPKTIPGLFEIEWRVVSQFTEQQRDALSVIALENSRYSISSLSEMVGCAPEALAAPLGKLAFLTWNNEVPSFLTDPFRQFAETKLDRRRARQLVLAYLLKRDEHEQTVGAVPEYMAELGHDEELIAYLTPSRFSAVLRHSRSLNVLLRETSLGIRTASKLGRDGHLTRFALQSSNAAAMVNAEAWREEIEARVRLGDVESAKRIARNTMLKEVRLQQLALAARTLRSTGRQIEPDLLADIEDLFESIDRNALGDDASITAADLIYSRPELAVRLLQETAATRISEGAKTMLMLETASKASGGATGANATLYQESGAKLQERMEDQGLQQMSRAAWLLYAKYSAEQMIAEVAALPGPIRVELLRYWLVTNPQSKSASAVLDYALDAIVSATEVSPSASILMDFATPLPMMEPGPGKQRMLQRLDALAGTSEKLGPTSDYVEMMLRIVEAHSRDDKERAWQRLLEVDAYVADVGDAQARAECAARLLGCLARLEQVSFPDAPAIRRRVETLLEATVAELLSGTAEHVRVVHRMLGALVPSRADLAVALAMKLNVRSRRDEALYIIVRTLCHPLSDEECLEKAIDALGRISSPRQREKAALAICERALDRENRLSDTVLPRAWSLLANLQTRQAETRALCLLYAFEVTRPGEAREVGSILERLRSSWLLIEAGWERTAVGFAIANELAVVSPANAAKFIEEADAYRRDIGGASDSSYGPILYTANLSIRALSGLLVRRLEGDADIRRLSDLISMIPSELVRTSLWADLALRYWIAKRTDDAKDIISKRILPSLESLSRVGPSELASLVRLVIGPLYACHRALAEEWLAKIGEHSRQECYALSFSTLLRKWNANDSYRNELDTPPELTYAEALELLEIVQQLKDDDELFDAIERLAKVATARRNRSTISRDQLRAIGDRVEALARDRLPDTDNISHDGYLVLCLACAALLRGDAHSSWDALRTQASLVPNVSDRVFVYASLAVLVPQAHRQIRSDLLERALSDASLIPVAVEQAERLRWIAGRAVDCNDPLLARRTFERAWNIACSETTDSSMGERRRIIDEAHAMDPELAKLLIDKLDDDPARKAARDFNAEHYAKLERDRKRADASGVLSKTGAWDPEMGKSAWRMLGLLNAGKGTPITKERAREWVSLASRAPIDETYPVFSLVIESFNRKWASTAEAAVVLRQMFDGVLLTFEATMAIEMRSKEWLPRIVTSVLDDPQGLLVRPGERARALSFISTWLERATGDTLIVCDPYFSSQDLELLRIVRDVAPGMRVRILTSQQAQAQNDVHPPYDAAFGHHWRRHVSESEPPDTEVVVAGVEPGGHLPIHDRWWFVGEAGLRCGTSFNGLGGTKESEISVLSQEEVSVRRNEVARFLDMRPRESDGKKVRYNLFNL